MKKFLTTLLLWFACVPIARAQFGQGTLDQVANQANLKTGENVSLPVIIGGLIKVLLGLLGIVFLLLTVYAGYLYLTARGDSKKVDEAKETLSRGVIGLIIIFAAYAIAVFIINALTKATTG